MWQLQLQRIQLADQTRIQERQQANAIDVTVGDIDGAKSGVLPSDNSEPVHGVAVVNGSNRPIREVACKMEAIEADGRTSQTKLADVYGEIKSTAEAWELQEHGTTMPVLRAGHKAGFIWSFTAAKFPMFSIWVRFTDDAGLHWQITTDLHLEKLASRDW